MELRDLRYFCVTAELEHVTRASVQLNIAQPHLTRVIHQIEAEIGGELFDKENRRLKLNENGKVFYNYARQVLADMDLLHTEMDYIFDHKLQTITLLCNTESFAMQLIKAFNKQMPNYTLSVLHVPAQEMLELLNSGKAQFAFSCPPLEPTSTYNMVETIDILSVGGCAILPPGHPLIGREHIDIHELRDEKLITMPRDNAMRNRLKPIFDETNFRPKIALECNNLSMIIEAVKEGLGYAFVSELILSSFPEMLPYTVLVDIPDAMGYYGLSYNTNAVESRNGEHFKNFASNFFSDLKRDMIKIIPR